MAGTLVKPTLVFTILSILLISSTFPTTIQAKKHSHYSRTLNPSALGLKKEKLTHFRVYWHDVTAGPNATALQIVPPVNTSSPTSGFGTVVMIDDPLTIKPELSSKLVGRAQGLYALSAQNELGLMMVMNFCFMEGKYNGSTISIMGRNRAFSKVREMPIIGGSGLFRFARGYVQASTHKLDMIEAVVEYNVYVLHY